MEAQLIEKNYKRFKDSFYNSLGLYQKKLNVDGEDLYINFYKYKVNKISTYFL